MAAALAAGSGQTVLVAAGTYAEQVTVANSGSAGSPVIFQAASPGAVTVTGAGGTHGFVITGRSFVTIDGFTVTGTSREGIYVSASDHVTVSNSTVTGSGHRVAGQNAAGIELVGVSTALISGDRSDNNSLYGFHVGGSSSGVVFRSDEASSNAEGWGAQGGGDRGDGSGHDCAELGAA